MKFKYWVDNEASKFRDLEIYSKGGEPYFKFYNKKGMVLDEMILSRYDSEEINKILIGFGQKYVPDLTWKMGEDEQAIFNAVASGDSERRADL